MIYAVQQYGQIRLSKVLLKDYSRLVALSPCEGGILAAPFRPGDEDDPEITIARLSCNRFSLPLKLRQSCRIGKLVEVTEMEQGRFLIRPYEESGTK